jgi:transcriptional regulator with XRE-family HTH domain
MLFLNKLDGDIMIELGEQLRQLRKSKKYSQQELADIVGVSRRLIVDIEAGRGTSLLVFVKILKTFNKTEKLLEILNTTNVSPKEMYKKENK